MRGWNGVDARWDDPRAALWERTGEHVVDHVSGVDYPELAPDQAYWGDLSSRIIVQAEDRLFEPAESPGCEEGDQ